MNKKTTNELALSEKAKRNSLLRKLVLVGLLCGNVCVMDSAWAEETEQETNFRNGFTIEGVLPQGHTYLDRYYGAKAPAESITFDSDVTYSLVMNRSESLGINCGVYAVSVNQVGKSFTYNGKFNIVSTTDVGPEAGGNNAHAGLSLSRGNMVFNDETSIKLTTNGSKSKSTYGISLGYDSQASIIANGQKFTIDITSGKAMNNQADYCETIGIDAYKGDFQSSADTIVDIDVTGTDETEFASPVYGIVAEPGSVDIKGTALIDVTSNGGSDKGLYSNAGNAIGVKVVNGMYNSTLGDKYGVSNVSLNNATINAINNGSDENCKAIALMTCTHNDASALENPVNLVVKGNLTATATGKYASAVEILDGTKAVIGNDTTDDVIKLTATGKDETSKARAVVVESTATATNSDLDITGKEVIINGGVDVVNKSSLDITGGTVKISGDGAGTLLGSDGYTGNGSLTTTTATISTHRSERAQKNTDTARDGASLSVTAAKIEVNDTGATANNAYLIVADETTSITMNASEEIKLDVTSANNIAAVYAYGAAGTSHAGAETWPVCGQVTFGGEGTLTINVDSSKVTAPVGLYVRSTTSDAATLDTPEERAEKATITVNTANTVINVGTGTGIKAVSGSNVTVNSNLVVNAKDAINSRGLSKIDVNTDGKHTTKLNGDIAFDYDGANSFSGVDAYVNVNLTGSESYWKGNSKVKWSGKAKSEIEAQDLSVTGFALIIADGATWTPSYVADQGKSTDTSGYFYNQVNSLTMNGGGIINIEEDNTQIPQVKVGKLTGTKGIVNMVDGATFEVGSNDNKDLTVNGGTLVYTDSTKATVDTGEKLTLNGTNLTQKLTVIGTANITGGDINVVGDTGIQIDEGGSVTINNNSFSVTNKNGGASGIHFTEPCDVNVTTKAYSVSAKDDVTGISHISYVGHPITLTVNGDMTMTSTEGVAYGLYFSDTCDGAGGSVIVKANNLTVEGVRTYGVLFNITDAVGELNLSGDMSVTSASPTSETVNYEASGFRIGAGSTFTANVGGNITVSGDSNLDVTPPDNAETKVAKVSDGSIFNLTANKVTANVTGDYGYGLWAKSKGVINANLNELSVTGATTDTNYAVYVESGGKVTLDTKGDTLKVSATGSSVNKAIYVTDSNSVVNLGSEGKTVSITGGVEVVDKSSVTIKGDNVTISGDGASTLWSDRTAVVSAHRSDRTVDTNKDGGSVNITSENLTISDTGLDNTRGYLISADETTTISFNATNITLTAGGSGYVSAVQAYGSGSNTENGLTGGKVIFNGGSLNINVTSTNANIEDKPEGLRVQNCHQTGVLDDANKATINIDNDYTNINVTNGKGIYALSEGLVNIKSSDLTITAERVISARGLAAVNINTEGSGKTVLNGNIDFEYDGTSSGSANNANVNVVLNGSDSVWTGNSTATWYSLAGEESTVSSDTKLDVSALSVTLSGGTWVPTAVEFKNVETSSGSGKYNGQKQIAVNTLTMNEGILDMTTAATAEGTKAMVGTLAGTKGEVKMEADNTLEVADVTNSDLTVNGGTLVYTTDAKAKVDVGEKLTLNGTKVTQALTNAGELNLNNVTGTSLVNKGNVVAEGTLQMDSIELNAGKLASEYGNFMNEDFTAIDGMGKKVVFSNKGILALDLTNKEVKTFNLAQLNALNSAYLEADGETGSVILVNGKLEMTEDEKENYEVVIKGKVEQDQETGKKTATISDTTTEVVNKADVTQKGMQVAEKLDNYVEIVDTENSSAGNKKLAEEVSTVEISNTTIVGAKAIKVESAKDGKAKLVITKESTVTLYGGSDENSSVIVDKDGKNISTDVEVTEASELKIGNADGKVEEQNVKLESVGIKTDGVIKVNNAVLKVTELDLDDSSLHVGEGSKVTAETLTAGSSVGEVRKSYILGVVETGTLEVNEAKGSKGKVVIYAGKDDTDSEDNGQAVIKADKISLQGNTFLLDPAWKDGVGLEGASSFTTGSTDLDGHYIVGQNSIISFGTTDKTEAEAAFAASKLAWGENDVTAAAYLAKSINVASGSLIVDGKYTSESTSLPTGTNGNVVFGENSLLMVDAGICLDAAAISGITELKVADTSKLYIADADPNKTYTILAAGASVVTKDNTWEEGQIVLSDILEVDNVEVATDGTYFKVSTKDIDVIPSYIDQTVASNTFTAMIIADEDTAAHKYMKALCVPTISDSAKVAEMDRNADMQEQVGVAHSHFNVSNMTEEAVAKHLALDEHNQGKEIWAQGIHSKENVSGLGLSAQGNSYDTQYNGAIVGVDFAGGEKTTFGVALTYVDGKATAAYGSRNEGKYYGATLYGRSVFGKATGLQYDISYTHSNNDLTLGSSVGLAALTGDQKVDSFSIGARLEQEMKAGHSTSFVPHVGVRWYNLMAASFKNNLGTDYDPDKARTFIVPLGLSFKTSTENAGWKMSFLADGGYQWNLGDRDYSQHISYDAGKDCFDVAFIDRGSWYAGAGLEFNKKNFTGSVGYRYAKGSSTRQNRWNVNLTWGF